MRKLVLSLSVAALALTGANTAFAQMGHRPNPDANGDGIATLAELQAHGAEMFARMDANGDGVLNDADRAAHGAEMFAKADTNGDGQLSADEMKVAHEARKERREERRAERAEKRGDRMAELFAAADTDNSGGLSQDELRTLHESRGKRGGRGARGGPHKLFGLADTDGDKAVTRAEFDTAVAAHFASIDTDGNGAVSKEEMQAAHKAMGGRMHRGRDGHGES